MFESTEVERCGFAGTQGNIWPSHQSQGFITVFTGIAPWTVMEPPATKPLCRLLFPSEISLPPHPLVNAYSFFVFLFKWHFCLEALPDFLGWDSFVSYSYTETFCSWLWRSYLNYNPFISLHNTYLLIIYYVPGSVLSAEYIGVNKTVPS